MKIFCKPWHDKEAERTVASLNVDLVMDGMHSGRFFYGHRLNHGCFLVKCAFLVIIIYLLPVAGNRFVLQEERGSSSRLRFTSGSVGYYNATIREIEENSFSCDIKMGIYIYDSRTVIRYEIDDKEQFLVNSERIQDFYFLKITPKSPLNLELKPLHILKVKAYESRTQDLIDETKIYLKVTDVNEWTPTFINKSVHAFVPENITVGSVALKVHAIDKDDGLNGKVYYFIPQHEISTVQHFRVNPITGDIMVIRPLEVRNQDYVFHVAARDRAPLENKRFVSTPPVSVRITVTKIAVRSMPLPKRVSRDFTTLRSMQILDKISANFLKNVYSAEVSEIAPPYTAVLRVSIHRAVDGRALTGAFYGIDKGNEGGNFQIESRTGLIYTVKDLDYETSPKLNFSVIAYYHGTFIGRASVQITVLDGNDHPPAFRENVYKLTVHENSIVGTKILTVTATDRDTGKNGEVSYAIANTDQVPFAVIPTTGEILVSEKLDLDKGVIPSTIFLRVRASDQGEPVRREAETLVEVSIKPVNDKPPVLKYKQCQLVVDRKTPVRTVILSVPSVDIDYEGASSPKYSLVSDTDGQGYFDVNVATGQVLVKQSLASAKSEYKIVVSATDGHNSALNMAVIFIQVSAGLISDPESSFARHNCTVSPDYARAFEYLMLQKNVSNLDMARPPLTPPDKNYHAPEFLKEHKEIITVKEDLKEGTQIAKFKAVDEDVGCYGLVLYSIVAGNIDSSFDIGMLSGSLYLSGPLDRELRGSYQLKVRAWDSGNPRNYRDTTVQISVKDVNDNYPEFENSTYYVEVTENVGPDFTLAQVKAEDSDDGSNGEVRYHLVNDYDIFSIGNKSGLIITRKNLDYELQSEYWLEVQAMDGSLEDQKVSQALVLITVKDINDNSPKCLSSSRTVEISKDFPPGTVITRVMAQDPDVGKGGTIRYKIGRGRNRKLLSIDEVSGVLTINSTLVSEKASFLDVTVVAYDLGKPSLRTKCQIQVNLKQLLGSEKPIFTTKLYPLYFVVQEKASLGSVIGTVQARSPTVVDLQYDIVDGPGLGIFSISKNHGVIKTLKKFSNSHICHYWITVQAYVKSDPSVYSNIPVLIRINRVKVKPPYFSPSVYRVKVDENMAPGTRVLTLIAVDPDMGLGTSRLRYGIVGGNDDGAFSIKGGVLVTTMHLDYEAKNSYILNVSVVNTEHSNLLSFAIVTVSVQDKNDHAPKFVENIQGILSRTALEQNEKTVSRLNPRGTPITQVLALDKDSGANGFIEYSISDFDLESKFSIDHHTGQIFCKETLTPGELIFLHVLATDKGTPRKNVSTYLEITIHSRPTLASSQLYFKQAAYTIEMQEMTKEVSGPISILDLKQNLVFDNAVMLFFSIVSGNEDGKFYIDEGVKLCLVAKLDYEVSPSYKLSIDVTDGIKQASVTVNVVVRDLNDNKPTTSQSFYEVSVMENQKAGQEVIKVEGMDLDKLSKGRLLYEIIRGSLPSSRNAFTMDKTTGIIRTAEVFDHEEVTNHVLTISIQDHASLPIINTSVSVIVNIQDANDHTPEFVATNLKLEIDGNFNIGAPIGRIYANDRDSGVNALLKYSILRGNEEGQFFLDQQSGVIVLRQRINVQSVKIFNLLIEISDNGYPVRKANKTYQIIAQPKRPEPSFSSKRYDCRVRENSPPGTLVSADIRVHPDRQVVYSLERKQTDCVHSFLIDVFSGVITTKVTLDAEAINKCKFGVVGITSEGLQIRTSVHVAILDVNDNSPLFTNGTFMGSVLEGFNQGSEVMSEDGRPLRVRATDRDKGRNARIRYEIVEKSASKYFKLNPRTGRLSTAQVLDREKVSQFNFHVQATDSGNPALVSFARVVVAVLDINDAMPEFVASEYTGSMYRPAYNGTQILTVKAIDADTAAFGNISYRLGAHRDVFRIDQALGIVVLKNSRKLQASKYSFRVTASDGIFSSSVPVSIAILPIPNTKFRFTKEMYQPQVKENLREIRTVLMLQTVGYDVGECVSYRILNPNPFFTIDSSSGVIKTKGVAFDREEVSFFTLIIQAKVERYFPKVAQAVVNVTVGDENDNKPLFVGAPYFKSVDINTEVGKVLIKVRAVDKDIGANSDVRYKIQSGDMGIVVINTTTGAISMKEKFVKGRAPAKLVLQVQARDQGHPSKSAMTTVEFLIVNEDMPVFNQMYNVSVLEESMVGTVVAVISAKGPQHRDVYYSISKGDDFDLFDIDFNSGELTVAGRLNRETQDSFSLFVKATDSKTGSWSETSCRVLILDINNNIPLFEKPSYFVSVRENMTTGTSIVTVKAIDDDRGNNSQLTYSVAQDGSADSALFTVDAVQGVVKLAGQLNFERKRQHRVKLRVKDNGTPALSSFTFLNVNVLDVNDNAPKFDAMEYNFFVSGNWKLGQFVGKVQAEDLDDISLPSLEYTMTDSALLKIDRNTGIITLANDPGDMELQKHRVHCTDGKFRASAHVTVRFVASNRAAPSLTQQTYSLSIQEGADPSFITVLSATDLDQGLFGQIHYSIESTFLRSKFHISELTGEIFSKVPLDREGEGGSQYRLPVRAMDGGGKFGFCEAIIDVLDQNDNTPIFEYPFYRTFISTKVPLGTEILAIKAVDKDTGDNADITYRANGLEDGNSLKLDRKTGIVKLVAEPSGMGYSFLVVASDNGYPVRESTTKVRVDIVESSSSLIAFDRKSYTVSVSEDAEPGFTLIKLNTTVKGASDRVEYEIMDGNLESTKVRGKFQISAGVISLKSTLDYEKVKKYKLMVKASIPSSTVAAFASVEVHVNNVNDEPPVFDSSFYEVSVTEDTPIGSRILLLIARDKDKNQDDGSARVRYKFATAGEDVRKTFSVHSQTGWVTVSGRLDAETKSTFEFMIKAQDGKKNSKRLTDYTSVRVKIIDVNDSPPAFLHPSFIFFTREDHIVGQKVAQLLAEDRDTDPKIRYYITSGNSRGLFSLNSVNGEITLGRGLDRELQNRHELEVVAYDGVFKTPAKVVIVVNDTIDNDPICNKAYYVHKVTEGPSSVKSLFTVEVDELDSTDVLSFSLQGVGATYFMVNEKTGEVSSITELDYERQRRYRFLVQAVDLGGHSCTSDVIIDVTDVNDNRPEFSQSKYITTVRENASLSVMVSRVRAVDTDEGTNRKISYSLLTDFAKTFSIQESSGILVLEKKLNKKLIANYSLRVQAKDHGTPPRNSVTTVDIIVLGISDSPPVFEHQSYGFNVSESSQSGHTLGYVRAKSVSGARKVEYHLGVGSSRLVRVNVVTGRLELVRALDYELNNLVTFSVTANYENVPSLSSAVSVTIHVQDVNDNAPVFPSRFYKRNIDENVRPGTYVASVDATDADSGQNGAIRYKILNADPSLPFVINQITGTVSVGSKSQVDRESVARYRLKVRAEDLGTPKLYSDVDVQIDIADLNDCPPIVDRPNGTVLVQETKPVGSVIYTIRVKDDDLPQNGPPFRYTITKGDKSQFIIRSAHSGTEQGNLVVKRPLNAAEQAEYRLTIRVDDNGSPPQYAVSYVTVHVVQASRFPPVIQEPTTFFILTQTEEEIFIGKVMVTDPDEISIHQFKITSGNDDGTFAIDDMKGYITGHPRKGVYTLGVEVTDGKFSDSGTIKILVNEITNNLYDNSVMVSIQNVKPTTFVSERISMFVSLLSRITGSPVENVVIWAVQPGSSRLTRRNLENGASTDIALAVRKSNSEEFIPSDKLESIILRNRNTLAAKLRLGVNIASPASCSSLPCVGNKKCMASLIPVKNSGRKKVMKSQLLTHTFTVGYKCICQNGRTGPDCSQVDVCSENPCSEGERCIAQDNSYFCECINSKKCNLLGESVTLDGTGFIGYSLITPFDVLFKTIKVSFRTEEKEGILFYAQGQDYCIIQVKEGRVQFKFDYGSGPAIAAVNELQVNDGQWHDVQVKRIGKVAFISLDGGKFESSGQSPGESVKINLNGNRVYFGAGVIESTERGKPRSSVFSGFRGCIRNPSMNGIVLPWTGSNSIVKAAQAFSVRSQCKDSGMCGKIACPYFSECINTLTSYRCECLPGHKGPFCTARVSCSDRPCLNHGKCYYTEFNGKIEYRCSCRPQYSGAQCQVYVGACGRSPCRNKGTCVPYKNSYSCNCAPRFQGRHCEIDTNPCASSPCLYGTCQQIGSHFRCDCPLGRTGKTCGYGEYCRRTRCDNGGACRETLDGALCKCPKGFKGPLCQIDVNECLERKPLCQKGTCVNTVGSYYCNCTGGFTGPSCARQLARKDSKLLLPLYMILVIVISSCLVIVIVLSVVCCRCRRKCVRKRRERAMVQELNPVVKYPYDFHELTTFPRPPPLEATERPPDYHPDDYGVGYPMDNTVLYDPQQVGSSGDSMSSHTDSCAKRPLSDDGSVKEEKVYLRTFDPSPHSTPIKRGKRTFAHPDEVSMCSNKSDQLRGYHWDYTGVPEDVMVRSKHNRKMSHEGSHLGEPLTETAPDDSQDEALRYVNDDILDDDIPLPSTIPKPPSRRWSLREGEQVTINAPKHVCLSRTSLPKTGTESPLAVRSFRPDRKTASETNSPRLNRGVHYGDIAGTDRPAGRRKVPEYDVDPGSYQALKTQLTTNEFKNRYSLTMDDDNHSLYLPDMLVGGYPAPPSETCPSDIDTCTKPSMSETHSEIDIPRYTLHDAGYDDATITSFSSDEEGLEYLDNENPRKLEKDLKALIRDIVERTNADV